VTTLAELELAAVHLLRARELASFYGWPEEVIKQIDLLKRGVARTKEQMANEQSMGA
jgi:hypothetical protein